MQFYDVGERIRELRKEQKLTQEKLAQQIGITRQTLSKLENGFIHKVSLQTFLKIIDILNYEMEIIEKKPFYYFDVEQI